MYVSLPFRLFLFVSTFKYPILLTYFEPLVLSYLQLIEELYSPNPSHDINQIQQNLQSVQKSENGYYLANELLANPSHSSNVKYFGALTLTVQLTTNSDSRETLWQLFKCNLLHLSKFCSQYIQNPQDNRSLITIIKKLMSNLSLIFTNLNESRAEISEISDEYRITHWNNPVNTLIQLLSQYSSMPEDQWSESPQMEQILRQSINSSISYNDLIQTIQSSPLCNKLVLMFTEIIVEDLTKFQTRKNHMSKVYEVVHEHLYISTMALINANLTLLHSSEEVLFNCINAWISYISMARTVSKHGRMDLSEMFENMINVMCDSTDNTDHFCKAEKILGIIGSVFANDPTLMGFDLRERIEVIFVGVSRSGRLDISKHNWMLQYMNHLVTNEMTEQLKELAVCMVDFLQINTLDVCNKLFTTISQSNIDQDSLQQYIKVLLQMTNFPLTPVLEESFSVRMVDFWLDLSETYTNLASGSLAEHGPQLATEIFQQVINTLLPKISLLNKQKIIFEDDDGTSVHEFDDFRAAVSDLVESLWSTLGNDKLTNVLITGVGKNCYSAENAATVDVFEIEAMAFLLNTLLRDMTLSESPWVCDIIDSSKFFVKNILMLLQTGYETAAETAAAKVLKLDFIRTSTTLLGTLAGYFQISDSHLNICIGALFHGLERTTINRHVGSRELDDKLEILTVKALSTLCEVCRKELSSSLVKLLDVLNSIMMPDSNVSNFTRERLMRSVGFIIESKVEEGPGQQAKYILQLVDMVENLIRQGMLSSLQEPQERRGYLHCLLTCISELGTSLICSEETENPALLQRLSDYNEYWNTDPLQLRVRIMDLVKFILSDPSLSGDPEYIEVSCLILGKALDLSDDEPHFLKYSVSEIMQFILDQVAKTNISASLPYYVYLLEKLINQCKGQLTSEDFDFVFEQVFLTTYEQTIISDPDLLQTMINFINSILECKPSLLIHSRHWTNFILPEFLKLLSVKEKFTIVAITKFWTKTLNNKKYTQEDLAATQRQIISIGQDLVSQTMLGLYHTQRSDISSYTDLLRALVAKLPMQTKAWLINALPLISDNHMAHEKLINKLSVTRGNRAAGSVILEWWLECNQLPAI